MKTVFFFTSKFFFLHLFILFLIVPSPIFAQLVHKPYKLSCGFESDGCTIEFDTAGGTYTINEIGITTDHAHSGTKSYVIDVTFGTARYVVFKVPDVLIPIENELDFTGWLRIESEGGDGFYPNAGFGRNLRVLPINKVDPMYFDRYQDTSGEWKEMMTDAIADSESTIDRLVKKEVWEGTKEHVGARLEKFRIFLYGKTGQRIRVFIDDINFSGNVPTYDSFEDEVDRRWAAYIEIFNDKMNDYTNKYVAAELHIAGFSDTLSTFDRQVKLKAESKLNILPASREKYNGCKQRTVLI